MLLQQFYNDSAVYENTPPPAAGIPHLRWYGVNDGHNFMVTELLGPSLEDLFTACNRQFSLKTVLHLADQCLARIEFLHSRNVAHRDIKPDNFLIGRGRKAGQVYIIDFGLAKQYRCLPSYTHIAYRDGHKWLTGTARCAPHAVFWSKVAL